MKPLEIVAVRHDDEGKLSRFKLSNGQELDLYNSVHLSKRPCQKITRK